MNRRRRAPSGIGKPGQIEARPGAGREWNAKRQIQAYRAAERGLPPVPADTPHAMAIVYPNTYFVGMANLGHQVAWRVANAMPGWRAERFYCDITPPLSMENGQPPQAFIAVAFSLSYELDWLNVLGFLRAAGIPLEAAQRGPEHPLVVVAGVGVSLNRAPGWPNADIFVHGEAESVLSPLLGAIGEHSSDRRQLLESVANLPGIEVTTGARQRYQLDIAADPSADAPPAPPRRVIAESLGLITLASVAVTPNTEFGDMCLVEIARGCPYKCPFCFVGHNLDPYRTVPLAALKEWITERRPFAERIGLLASAVASHPDIVELCEWCEEIGARISFSSLRAEDVRPELIGALARGGAQSLTIAPEAGGEALRARIGKARLPDARILDVTAMAADAGLPGLKLYFMIGLPGETLADMDEIARLVGQVRNIAMTAWRARRQAGWIGVNASVFVPKPGTPFASHDSMDEQTLRRHSAALRSKLARLGNVRFTAPSITEAAVQRILCSGGPATNSLIVAALDAGGDWRKALARWRRH